MLRVVVIGAGKISEEHLSFLKVASGVKLVGVCDLSPSLAGYAVRRFGAERSYRDHCQMIAETVPDVVHVLTPPHTHPRVVTDALKAGAHVIVEKPIATNNAEYRLMSAHAARCGKLLIEDHNYRFNEPFCRVERIVTSGRIGEIVEVEVRMAQPLRSAESRYNDPNLRHSSHQMPAGALHEFITHLAYLTLRFLPQVDEVRARWRNLGGGDVFKFDDLDATVIGGTVHARLRFSSRLAPAAFSVTVRGTRGWIETELYQPYLRMVVPRGLGPLSPLLDHLINGLGFVGSSAVNFKDKFLHRKTYEGLHRVLEQTYIALRNDTDPPVTFQDMDRASQLIDALLVPENQV